MSSYSDRTFHARIINIREFEGDKMRLTMVTPRICEDMIIENYWFERMWLLVTYRNEKGKIKIRKFDLRDYHVLNILGENMFDRRSAQYE